LSDTKKEFYFHDAKDGNSILLSDGVTLGRSSKSDICIPDDNLSSRHLSIDIIENKLFVTDLNTSNGSKVNGENITSGSKVELFEGDTFGVGQLSLTLSINEALVEDEKTKEMLIKKSSNHNDSPEIIIPEQEHLTLEKKISSIDTTYTEEDEEDERNVDNIQLNRDTKAIHRAKQNNLSKISKISEEIDKIDKKLIRKDTLAKEADDIFIEHKTLIKKGPNLKDPYNKNKREWNDINSNIRKFTRQINVATKELVVFNERRSEIAEIMETYESYLEVSEKCSAMTQEVEEINNKDFGDKKQNFKERIQALEIKNNVLDKELEQKRENNKIKKEIRKLESKLKN